MKKLNLLLLSTAFLLLNISISTAQRSLYQDYKAQRIGDVVTIVLQENISGRSNTDFSNRSNTSGSAQGSITGNIPGFLPVFGADASVDYRSSDDNESSQSNLLRGTVSARVIDVTPNGDLLVEGFRKNEINGEYHSLTIKGFVRSQDIDDENRVPSFRIANAEIIYEKDQSAEHMRKRPGFFKKLAFGVLAIGLGIAALVK